MTIIATNRRNQSFHVNTDANKLKKRLLHEMHIKYIKSLFLRAIFGELLKLSAIKTKKCWVIKVSHVWKMYYSTWNFDQDAKNHPESSIFIFFTNNQNKIFLFKFYKPTILSIDLKTSIFRIWAKIANFTSGQMKK